MMEHRWDTRIHAPVSVVIYTGEGTALRSLTHNISRGEICVEMEKPKEVESKSDIEKKKVVMVEFNYDRSSVPLPALILRRSDKTAALMFITHPLALRPFLDQLIS